MAKNTKGKKSVESVAETLCNFSRFLCDLVIGIDLCGKMSASVVGVVADFPAGCSETEAGTSGIPGYSEKHLAGFEYHG